MRFESSRPVWERDGRDWPNREASRFVKAAGLRWHVQTMGEGPVLLLVHGTGAATHSWRALAPILARHFTVVAPDLPGHGFTDAPPYPAMTLEGMGRSLGALLVALDVSPVLAAGHSAGAAILIRMCLDGVIRPGALVSLNGALLPFRGAAAKIFPSLAKLMFLNPLTPRVFAWGATDRARVERLIRDTGSTLEPAGVELYARLVRTPGHVSGALGMMANWNLDALERDLPRLGAKLLLVAGGNDRAVPPEAAFQVRDRLPGATVEYLRGLGHLAHEERPQEIATLIVRLARAEGILPQT